MRKIGIGIIGFGNMGMAHSYSVENLKFFASELGFEAKIIGVCTTSQKKSEDICKRFGFPVAFGSADELIAHPDVDVVDVCTPNNLHLSQIKAAAAAGKHILCEKPLCPTYAEAKEAEMAASGVINGIVFNNRHLSAIKRAKEIIDEGRIGRILSFEASYLHNSCLDPRKTAGWKQSGAYGAGVLRDLGSHALDLVYYLCGRFSFICAKKQIAFTQRKGVDGSDWATDADEAVYINAVLECGAHGTVHASKLICGANDDLSISVYGEKGSLKFSLAEIDTLKLYESASGGGVYGKNCGYTHIECNGRYPYPFGSFPSPKATQGWLRGHVMSMYEFLRSVSEEKNMTPSFSDGAYIAALCDAADISDREGRWVRIEEILG